MPIEDAPGRRFGDIGYMTLEVPDGDRARAFYEQVFGWSTMPSGAPGSFHVSSITPPSGIHGGPETRSSSIYFRVDDIEAAAQRVREAGGEVLSTANYDSGGNAECRRRPGPALQPLPPPRRLLAVARSGLIDLGDNRVTSIDQISWSTRWRRTSTATSTRRAAEGDSQPRHRQVRRNA